MDHFAYIHSLTEDKLLLEIEKMNKKLFKLNPASPMYDQLYGMIETAQLALAEMQYTRRFKDAEDKIIEIGTVEEHVSMPDYSKEELLLALVDQYKDKSKE
jgi:hypothetical protein